MTSTLLLAQFASQNIALFCCALFAGAATYVSLVEHPRLDEGEAELADATLLASHPRPAIFQAALGVVGSLAALLAGSAAGATWWLAGGAVLGAAALWQVFAVLPLIRRLTGSKGRANPKSAAQIIARLAKLHAALSLAALAALFMFIMKA
jgi:hypothetical protein